MRDGSSSKPGSRPRLALLVAALAALTGCHLVAGYTGSAGQPGDGGPRDAPVLPPGDGQKPASDAGKPKLDLPKPTLTWRKMVSPKKSNFYDVLPLSKTDVFVAGESGTLLHYNGNSKQQLTQVMSGTKWSLRALTPYGTGKVLAVGL